MSYNLAILHHHLNRGGVTQVIANHLRALDAVGGGPERVLLLYGGRRAGWPEDLPGKLANLSIELCEVPEIDYDDREVAEPRRLADCVIDTLSTRGCEAESTVVHVHNHSLGKNLSLPGALLQLANAGFQLLLQIHDFAEDFRPENYRRQVQGLKATSAHGLGESLYPQAGHIHYATLNGRDRSLLKSAGVRAERLHLLPNPVHESGTLPPRVSARAQLADRFDIAPDATFLLYPVRGIRRKNVGEALLWSALLNDDVAVGVTLNPISPVEVPSFDRWVGLARALSLPIRFGLGEQGGLGFADNLTAADAVLTTSVAEGFGMVFLETWLAGRPLLGRDLPEITEDFKAAGLRLSTLNSELRIPVSWVGIERFVSEFEAAYRQVLEDYGRPTAGDALRGDIDELCSDGLVDFACLSSNLQAQVVSEVATDAARRDELSSLNSWMQTSVQDICSDNSELIGSNAAAVRSFTSLEVSGKRLTGLYDMVHRSDVSEVAGLAHGERILAAFLEPARFHPIRVES